MGVVANMADQVGVIYAGTMVEIAEVVPLFHQPRHPYTWALLRSLPRLDDPDRKLQPLPGNPPDMLNLPEECPFLPRCHKALHQCRAELRPMMAEVEPDHMVACYNPVLQVT